MKRVILTLLALLLILNPAMAESERTILLYTDY